MNFLIKSACTLTLGLTLGAAFASPPVKNLIIHNNTNVESNAYINGVPTVFPSAPHKDNKVSWIAIRFACAAIAKNGTCSALIKMATNTSNPVNLGVVNLNLATGQISPSYIEANGYTMMVNGPGEATISDNLGS